jgi:hypothetical protein
MAEFSNSQYDYNLFLIQSCIYKKVLSLCKKEEFTIVCDNVLDEIKTLFTIYETLYNYIIDAENNCLTEEEINQILSVIKRMCGCNIKLLNV